MKAGLNYFGVSVTNTSGAGVPGISGGWSYAGYIGGNIVNFSGTTVNNISSNYYVHGITVPSGTGPIWITCSPYILSKNQFDVDSTTYTATDVITKLTSNSTIPQINSSSATVPYNIVSPYDDILVYPTLPLSQFSTQYGGDGTTNGWTFTTFSPSVSGIGAGTVTITNTTTGAATVKCLHSTYAGTTNNFVIEVRGLSPTSLQITVLKINVTVST